METIQKIKDNLDKFKVEEVSSIAISDGKVIINCRYNRSMKINKYLENILVELDIPRSQVRICSGYSGPIDELLLSKKYFEGTELNEDEILKRKPISSFSNLPSDLVDSYETKFVELLEDIDISAKHTNHCFDKDGLVAVHKFFDIDEPESLKLNIGDKLFIIKLESKYCEEIGYVFAYRTYDWYYVESGDSAFEVINKLFNSIN